jgi:hypothetical protein
MVVVTASSLGLYFVCRIIIKWHNSPIITSIDTPSYDVTNINFPAVTICPVYSVIEQKLVNEVCMRK